MQGGSSCSLTCLCFASFEPLGTDAELPCAVDMDGKRKRGDDMEALEAAVAPALPGFVSAGTVGNTAAAGVLSVRADCSAP